MNMQTSSQPFDNLAGTSVDRPPRPGARRGNRKQRSRAVSKKGRNAVAPAVAPAADQNPGDDPTAHVDDHDATSSGHPSEHVPTVPASLPSQADSGDPGTETASSTTISSGEDRAVSPQD